MQQISRNKIQFTVLPRNSAMLAVAKNRGVQSLSGTSTPVPAGNGLKTLAPYLFVLTFYQSKLEKR